MAAYELNMQYTAMDGTLANLNQYEGKPLLIDAWATWCESCKTTMVDLHGIYEAYGGNISILSVSVSPERDTLIKIEAFILELEENNDFVMTWDFGLDHDLVIYDEFDISFLPSLVLLDREGNMIEFWEGVTDPVVVVDTINSNFDMNVNFVPEDPGSQLFGQLLNNTPFRITVGLFAILFIYTVFIPKKKPLEEIPE
jgi:thiol-disulfide isomerase/thioredoxin